MFNALSRISKEEGIATLWRVSLTSIVIMCKGDARECSSEKILKVIVGYAQNFNFPRPQFESNETHYNIMIVIPINFVKCSHCVLGFVT